MMPPAIARPSVMSLYVTAKVRDLELGQGTAFLVESLGTAWLVTNWDIAAGRNRLDGQPLHKSGATPDTLTVWHNGISPGTGRHQWRSVDYALFDEGGVPMWFEHPVHGRGVDVVAIRVARHQELAFLPY